MGEAADLAREYMWCMDARDMERLHTLFDDRYMYRGPDGETRTGPQAAIDALQGYLNAFEDLRIEIDSLHEVGGTAICEMTVGGTHTGDFQGIPPTGRTVDIKVCSVIDCHNGRIVAEREYFDQLSIMTQLGLMDQPEVSPADAVVSQRTDQEAWR